MDTIKIFEVVLDTRDKLAAHIADEAGTHAQILGELKLLNEKRDSVKAELDVHVTLHKKWERRAYYMLVTFLFFAAERAWAIFHK